MFKTNTKRRYAFLGLAALLSLSAYALFWNLGQGSLYDWDEAAYAAAAKEMLRTDPWTPHLPNDYTYIQKPPLIFWHIMLMYRVFGVNELTARFPSALYGLMSILLIYGFGRKYGGDWAGHLWPCWPAGFPSKY